MFQVLIILNLDKRTYERLVHQNGHVFDAA